MVFSRARGKLKAQVHVASDWVFFSHSFTPFDVTRGKIGVYPRRSLEMVDLRIILVGTLLSTDNILMKLDEQKIRANRLSLSGLKFRKVIIT